jgi:murein hydrolase activator
MRYLLSIVLAGLSLAGLAGADSAIEVKERLEQVQAQIRAERARLAEVQGQAGALEAELARFETKIGEVAQRLRETMQHLAAEQAELAALEQRKQTQLAALERQREALAAQLRAAYIMGQQERLKLLLNQEDAQTVGRMLVYHDYVNRARAELIDEAQQTLAALRDLQYEMSAQSRQLRRVAGQLRQEQAELQATRARRAGILAQLRKEAEATDQQIGTLIHDEDELERLLESIQTALDDIPAQALAETAFDELKGELPWPSAGPILAAFGSDRTEAADTVWHGVMIGAEMGADVRAVAGGRVAFADWMRGFGLLAIIDHGNGYMSLYGNNQSLYKTIGEWVQAGELIARVGDSGGQPHAGLYFEIRHEGEPLDPAAWCDAGETFARSDS